MDFDQSLRAPSRYPIAACEVSLPNLRFRLDVAAYRPGSIRTLRFDAKRGVHRPVTLPAVGTTTLFECKASRPDLVRDCRNSARLIERMKELWELRAELEHHLKLNCPSLLKGDTRDAKQTADREAWHADTRAQVDVLKGHVDECDKDRDVLRKEQARLGALVNVRCPRRNCPMREG